MQKFRLKQHDLAPDGVRILIDWDAYVVGASVFVPAVNVVQLKIQFNSIADDKNWKVESRDRIESGKFGVRFWRLL